MSTAGEVRRRKMRPIESELNAITERLLEDVDTIGQAHNNSREFRAAVRVWLGYDFLDIYDEWVAEGRGEA